VAAEVQDAAWRLGWHPALALWTGNNEMASGYVQHGYYDQARYYAALYFATVIANLTAVDPTRAIVSSCPSYGNETAAVPFSPGVGRDTMRGDTHFYAQDNDCWDLTIYPRARFISEHGIESWPSFLTLAPTLTGPADYGFNASLPFSRQHHPPGQEEITFQTTANWLWPNGSAAAQRGDWFTRRFHRLQGDAAQAALEWRSQVGTARMASAPSMLPEDAAELSLWFAASPPNASTYANELWMSQVTQATCLKHALELWRRGSDEFNATGAGGTAGILYWQSNDIWPAPSWSSMEWGSTAVNSTAAGVARPKMLQYYAAAAFAPQLVSAYVDGWDPHSPSPGNATLRVYVANHAYNAGWPDGQLQFQLWSWEDGEAGGGLWSWGVTGCCSPQHPTWAFLHAFAITRDPSRLAAAQAWWRSGRYPSPCPHRTRRGPCTRRRWRRCCNGARAAPAPPPLIAC